MKDTDTPPVQHIGEFVLTKNGNLDFGEIPSEIAKVIRRQEVKIRLRIGVEIDNATGNYGEKHIERPERMEALKKCGFINARDFIEDVCGNYNAIYQGEKGSLILVKTNAKKNHIAIVKLIPSEIGDFYDVQTGYPSRKSGKNKKPLLWECQSERS